MWQTCLLELRHHQAHSFLKGKAVYFVSNNSSKSRVEYLEKFKLLDFEAHEV